MLKHMMLPSFDTESTDCESKYAADIKKRRLLAKNTNKTIAQ